jgi:hypothetical protein
MVDVDTREWATHDIALAAFIALEQRELRTEWDKDDQCHWIFEETDHVQDCVMAFMGGEVVEVSARDLLHSHGRLHARRRREWRERQGG